MLERVGGVAGAGEIADAVSADREALQSVLRHLVEKDIFDEPSPGQFQLNDAARGLLNEQLMMGLDLNGIGGRMANAWATLPAAVRTGRSAYRQAFGRDFWQDLEANPEIGASFDELMGPAGHGVPNPEVLRNPADWAKVQTVVDVGGGTGSLLAEILRARKNVRGVLVDLPRTVTKSKVIFEAAGVSDRVTASAQSFFDPLPAGADVYLLKNLLADWPDPEALRILQRCAAAAATCPRGPGRVVILGGVKADDKADSPELMMLVLVGGKGRSMTEFRKLASEAGLSIVGAGDGPDGRFAVECVPTVSGE